MPLTDVSRLIRRDAVDMGIVLKAPIFTADRVWIQAYPKLTIQLIR